MILFVVAASSLLDSIVVVDVVIEWSTSLIERKRRAENVR